MRWALFLLLVSCTSQAVRLTSVSLVDPRGFQETVTSPDRLAGYERTDFCAAQPYRKVLRVYEGAPSVVTSYHDNGHLHQLLEVSHGRASGRYEEYFPGGGRKLAARVMAGDPDLDPASLQSFLFEGVSRIWDEAGHLHAEIPYSSGELDGTSTYYYPSGQVARIVPYVSGRKEGLEQSFFEDGEIASQQLYVSGRCEGDGCAFWSCDQLAFTECYSEGLLVEGQYYDIAGKLVASVVRGEGLRATADEAGMRLVAYAEGVPSGEVREYGSSGELRASYCLQGGLKDGEEIVYYERPLLGRLPRSDEKMVPKMLITWRSGEMQGLVKSWYPSGQLESQREVAQNRRNGTSIAWYADGSLMLIEEYRDDVLVRGEYFGRGNPTPLSQVEGGNGMAMLFDANGNILRRVTYVDGMPLT